MHKRSGHSTSTILRSIRIMTTPPGAEQKLVLSVPTPEDFEGMAILQTAAFVEKQGWGESTTDIQKQNYQTYQRYHKQCPVKLQHCRIIKSTDGKSVQAACQLQLRRQKTADDEVNVFVEWIACHPDHMNKGMGSTLLKWATTFAKKELNAKVLTLYVVKANTGAVRLYKRRGFVVQNKGRNTLCNRVVNGILGVVCLGMDRHWTVLTMEKDLQDVQLLVASDDEGETVAGSQC